MSISDAHCRQEGVFRRLLVGGIYGGFTFGGVGALAIMSKSNHGKIPGQAVVKYLVY